MNLRNNRFKVIEQMIAQHNVSSQEVLLGLLVAEGFELTQATLSRDLKEMKVIKAPNHSGEYVYTLSKIASNSDNSITNYQEINSASGFLSIEFSGQMAVVKTRPGHASAIAYEIDEKASSIILGTIAGDDTILIIPREGIYKNEVLDAFSKLFSNKLQTQ
jgi:transcriptional regulator of arginine metabolism